MFDNSYGLQRPKPRILYLGCSQQDQTSLSYQIRQVLSKFSLTDLRAQCFVLSEGSGDSSCRLTRLQCCHHFTLDWRLEKRSANLFPLFFFIYNWWWLELGRWFRIATRTHMLARLFIMLTNSHNRVMGNS